ncbi:MAG: hypothetical protein R3F11_14045 [Verrucomicrobiales bacterium]
MPVRPAFLSLGIAAAATGLSSCSQVTGMHPAAFFVLAVIFLLVGVVFADVAGFAVTESNRKAIFDWLCGTCLMVAVVLVLVG